MRCNIRTRLFLRGASTCPPRARRSVSAARESISSRIGLRLRREVQLHRAPVAGMAAPLDPARSLHAVDEPRERDRLNLEAFGERTLASCPRCATGARCARHCACVRPSDWTRPVEAAAQQARDVVDQKANAAIGIESEAHWSGYAFTMVIISMLIISTAGPISTRGADPLARARAPCRGKALCGGVAAAERQAADGAFRRSV